MLLWKLLLIADIAILAGYGLAVLRGDERPSLSDYLTVPMGLVGTVGLAGYAFSLPLVSPRFWQIFLPLFAMSGAWEITGAATLNRFGVGTAVGAVLALVLLGLTCVALYRLAGAAWL